MKIIPTFQAEINLLDESLEIKKLKRISLPYHIFDILIVCSSKITPKLFLCPKIR